jgi:hypothetical protein
MVNVQENNNNEEVSYTITSVIALENNINEEVSRKNNIPFGYENSLTTLYNQMNDKWYCVIKLGYSRYVYKYFDTREELINFVTIKYSRIFGKLERIPFIII